MDRHTLNCWIGENRGMRLFTSNHFFIVEEKSLCGQFKMECEHKKHVKRLRFTELFKSRICLRCVFLCDKLGINYKI